MVAVVILFSAASLGCGAGAVELLPTNTCEGGNVPDCRDRCGKREGMPCYKLGWFHERGQEVDADFDRAMGLYQQSCEASWPQACRALGDLYWRGEKVGRNAKKTIEYWDRACTLGLDIACPTPLERDIADGKLMAVSRGNGSVSVSPMPNYQGPKPSTPSAPSTPSGPSAPSTPSLPTAP